MIHIEDYEREAQKDLVYLQEEMQQFYSSLNDPGKAQIEVFLSNNEDIADPQKLNPSIPATIIVEGDKKLLKNHERQVDSLPF